jgi:hypothetical protein
LHQLQQLVHPRPDLGPRSFADLQAKGNVLPHRHVLEQGVVLEDKANIALLDAGVGGIPTGEENPPRVRLF